MDAILFSVESGVAFITMNRPDKLNSFNRAMALQLQAIIDQCASDENIRAIYLTGAGKGFCAGQDLAEVVDPEGPGMQRILSEHYNPIVLRLREMQKPVVAAVNGVAAGAGANIAFACDIVVSKSSASFIQAFSKIGLIPDSGGTFTLPRLIGFQRASALMMLGDKVSATEALQMGMLYKIFEDEVFETESKKLALQLATMPTKALGYIKLALNASATNTIQSQLALEDELQQKAAATADFKEGVDAFLAKRAPQYKGQ
ncbi:enoyl-CoA hydratase-related protein [Sediminibacterium sp. TEGAF015]|uniref:enoyl-CoA hydratase-related protein n=1 Tax=Sediminibacterium sp. TEGAF015 TaxID=575378 RepID=UPI0021FD0BA0|nr:enoyl-CoA hydratase-related protein [Sediminibacterium sp. TEGAF015]BDQ13001.1 2-(1,2-epoxy-1,2-dihydrophenyl)acetyl-CoA isomerase [Sediminibacterium sp. TEGAF015]